MGESVTLTHTITKCEHSFHGLLKCGLDQSFRQEENPWVPLSLSSNVCAKGIPMSRAQPFEDPDVASVNEEQEGNGEIRR